MKRKLMCLLLAVSLVLGISATATAAADIKVILDGSELSFDVPPAIVDGRTMVPLRAIFEALGASVDWDGTTKTVTASRGSTVVQATIGQKTMTVSGETKQMDIAPMITDGRTLVPARFVAEAFGYDVQWDGNTKTVYINAPVKNSTEGVDSIRFDSEIYFMKPSERLILEPITEPHVENPHITWAIKDDPETLTSMPSLDDNGVIFGNEALYYCITVTATTDNGKTASCCVMALDEETVSQRVGGVYEYIKHPGMPSIENVTSEVRLESAVEIGTLYADDYLDNYWYVFLNPESAETVIHDYAACLEEAGYSLISSDDTGYNLLDPSGKLKIYLSTIQNFMSFSGAPVGLTAVSMDIRSNNEEIHEIQQSPVTIIQMCSDMDYVGGVRWTFDLRNNTDKTIKYVYLTWQCCNAVMDVVPDTIAGYTDVVFKITGPIKPGDTDYSIKNGTKFYNSEYANYIRMKNITVEYMDGTKDDLDVDYLTGYWEQDMSISPFEMALKGYVILVNMLE